jgi:hypothetical protein
MTATEQLRFSKSLRTDLKKVPTRPAGGIVRLLMPSLVCLAFVGATAFASAQFALA